MKTSKTFIPLVILLVTFMVTGDANNFVFASADYDRILDRVYAEQSEPSKTIKSHTVQNNENLTVIGKKYNASVASIAALNKLVNPNLVRRGQELLVEFLENKSIQVGPVASTPKSFPQGTKIIERTILPDKNNLLAPENPMVVYEVIQGTPKPQTSIGEIKVFQTLLAFFKWLDGTDYSKQTKGSGSHQVDPSPASLYMISSGFNSDTVFNDSLPVSSNRTFFDSYLPDSLSPPPKHA